MSPPCSGVLVRGIAGLLRWILRRLQSQRTRVGPFGRAALGVLFLPPFGTLLVFAHIMTRLGRPIRVWTHDSFGHKLFCELPDLVQLYVYAFGQWEPDVSDYIRRRLQHGGTFIDVGAHMGYFSVLASQAVDSHGRVIAIEPSPRMYKRLLENLQSNSATSNVRAVNMAVSNEAATVSLYSGPHHNLGLSTLVERRGFPKVAEVGAQPLLELISAEELADANIVKIDVEGGEDTIIENLHDFLEQCPPRAVIVLELSPQWWAETGKTPEDVLQPFYQAGFHAYEIDNNYWPWRYMWPHDVVAPQRIRRRLNKSVRRIDLVLSREDVEQL